MHRIIASGLIVLDTFFLPSLPPALAQRNQGRIETPECMAALRTAKNKIEKGKNVSVVDIPKKDIRQEYEEYPRNRPFSYNFYLSGSATESVLNSKALLLSLSTDIIKNCSSISIAEFGEYRTENYRTFGLIKEGIVKEFKAQCDSRQTGKKLPWGYTFCE